MRIPAPHEDLTGKVCVNSTGRVAIVTGVGQIYPDDWRVTRTTRPPIQGWEGLGLDGKGAWFSTNPCVVAETGKEFYDRLKHRFDGKMSQNG